MQRFLYLYYVEQQSDKYKIHTHLSLSFGNRKKCRFAIFIFNIQPGAKHQRVLVSFIFWQF